MTRPRLTKTNFTEIVDRQILEAIRNGAFDALPFKGEPLPELNSVSTVSLGIIRHQNVIEKMKK